MIERPRLWVGPWSDEAPGAASRVIRADDAVVGRVRRTRRRRHSWWTLLPAKLKIEVFETEDQSLLMSISPSAWAAEVWIVRDGDDREVGRLRGCDLLDPWNEPFACRMTTSTGWRVLEIGDNDCTYATAVRADDGLLIDFPAADVTNPFLRMLAFGSLLMLS